MGCRLACMLLVALPAIAQLQVGDYLHMNLNGTVGFNYGGGISQGLSDHSMGFTGNAVLTGNYYSPNFLSFNVDPYYDREQTNSAFGSLSNSTGVSSNLNLFNGTHFPGSISYNKSYNGISAFGVPGSDLGLAQHSNNQSFSVGWSALLPDLPTLNASYTIGNSSNDIVGQSGNDSENDRTLNLLSNYRWDGYTFSGQFLHRNTNTDFSEALLPGQSPTKTSSSSNSYGATVQHALPLSGNFGASFSRLTYGYHFEDSTSGKNSGNSDTINGTAAFHPTRKLGFSFIADYNDSLLGSIPQAVLNSGTPVNLASAGTFRSELVGSDVFYQVFKNLGIHANINHQNQSFLGNSYSATQFGGSAEFNFSHSILQGLSFGLGVVDTAQQATNTGLGFVGNLNYNRKFYGWDVGGNFSYSQNVQTALLVYTSSSYSYLASLRRRIGDHSYAMAGYSGSHSGITANSGTTSAAERIWAGFNYRGNTLNAYYNKSNGLAIFTSTGLVTVPVTVPTQALSGIPFTSYSSKGWGISLGVTPVRRLLVSASYGKADGSTIQPGLSIFTNDTLINATMQYRLRKIFMNGGYTRLDQSAGTLGSKPLMVTSYYIGFSRWFNFF
jgi:hypothetical protein